uniref:PepSY domain-containing protein n=1 Tax=Roseihalotalea indica TaxID=2867963 RepID=A0AA49JIH8_9BACT|nr:hypothetical protein K4G66_22455 [Tunicatimonas sp. TK19036]
MKKVFFALFTAAFLFSLSTFAQTEEEETQPEQEQTQPEETVTAMADEGMEIEFDQLPDAVKTSFESSDYAMWDVKAVYEVVSEEEETTEYKITVTDGTKEESVLFDEEGEEVEQY